MPRPAPFCNDFNKRPFLSDSPNRRGRNDETPFPARFPGMPAEKLHPVTDNNINQLYRGVARSRQTVPFSLRT